MCARPLLFYVWPRLATSGKADRTVTKRFPRSSGEKKIPHAVRDFFSKQMIKDVDGSEVIGPHLIESPVLGPISPKELSGGVKTLMLMKFDESGKIFNASACGDNCAPWICRIAREKDLTINLHHIMDFSGINDFKAMILNTGREVTGYKEYVDEAIEIEER